MQTEAKSGAGPVPRAAPKKTELTEEDALGVAPQILDWKLPRDDDAPYTSAAFRYINAGQIDQAFQCVFRFGNEKSLLAVLKRLESVATWQRLAEGEARYLVHLLVKLLCKDPLSAASLSACAWLDGLLRHPGGRDMLTQEDLPGLQAALFSMSGAAGEGGFMASSVYYRLFQIGGA
jgi:hypothetical protein